MIKVERMYVEGFVIFFCLHIRSCLIPLSISPANSGSHKKISREICGRYIESDTYLLATSHEIFQFRLHGSDIMAFMRNIYAGKYKYAQAP